MFTAVHEPPPLPVSNGPVVAPRFVVGMDGATLLAIIFRVCKEVRVSDIQMRSDRPVYIHTNKGVEKLDFLGILNARHLDEILKELITNRESASHGFGEEDDLGQRVEDKIQNAIRDFSERKVADFSCNGIVMGNNGERSGRLRIQAH
jgi:hypothetical protein